MSNCRKFSHTFVWSALVLIVIILLAPQVGAVPSLERGGNAFADSSANLPHGFPFISKGRLGGTLTCNGPDVTFDVGLPADWTLAAAGPVYWTLTEDSAGCSSAYEVGGTAEPGACASSDTLIPDPHVYDAELRTNSIDLSYATSATLDLRYLHRHLNNSIFDIDVSADNGQSWSNVYRDDNGNYPGGASNTVDLASCLSNPEVIVRFRYYGDNSDWYTQIDDVGLSCTLVPNIQVDPPSMGSILGQDKEVTVPLDIENDGGALLTWEVGEAQDCSSLEDIAWLSVTPVTGITAPGDKTTLDVTFKSLGLSLGTYHTNLCIFSDDPDSGPGYGTKLVVVPVELVVEADPQPKIVVDPLSMVNIQYQDTYNTLSLNINNIGDADLKWHIDETTGLDCLSPSDISWISANPSSGTTAVKFTTVVDVTLDASDLAPGTVNGNLCIFSDDPDSGPGNGTELVVVSVEMVVEEAPEYKTFLPYVSSLP